MSSRTTPAEFYCEICNTSFNRREHYQRHLRTHAKEKPFSCSECGQSFGRVDSLSRHHTAIHLNGNRQSNGDRQAESRRVSQACKPCNSSKVRCDGQLPCQRCRRSNNECFYETCTKRKSTETGHDGSSAKRPKNDNVASKNDTVNQEESNNTGANTERFNSNHGAEHMLLLSPESLREGSSCDNSHIHSRTSQAQHTSYDSVEVVSNQPQSSHNSEPTIGISTESMETQDDRQLDMEEGGFSTDLDDMFKIATPSMIFGVVDETTNWFKYNSDPTFLPFLMEGELSTTAVGGLPLEPGRSKITQKTGSMEVPLSPDPITDQSDVTELYSRSHTPAIDRDAVEPRQYHPISIEIDAQLVFPDMSQLAAEDVDEEHLAHVDDVSRDVVDKVTQYAVQMQHAPSFPTFVELRVPPAPVLNAWVQLYFEFFHPVFPILHMPSFTSSKRHWLLIFVVAAIGAHFSNIKDAHVCSRAMHELVRRLSAAMCERKNANSRELWMLQAITLNQIGLMYAGERRFLEIAEFSQSLPVTLARRKGFFTNIFPMHKVSQLQLPLEKKWQIWVLDEERRRVGFAIWLLDAAFDTHFDLSRLMRLSELQISLPQPDDCWAASTAQHWASFPSILEYNSPTRAFSINHVVADKSWKSAWTKTNTLGKQVMLQQLTAIINDQNRNKAGAPEDVQEDRLLAADILGDLLCKMRNEQIGHAIDEIKTSTTHQVMALTGLMLHNCPTPNLLPLVIRFIYGKLSEEEWTQMGDRWRQLSKQARLACFYAARILHAVRSSHCPHYGTPVSLSKAVFVLWAYSSLSQRFPEGLLQPSPAPTVVLGPKAMDDMDSMDWVEKGWSRVKLSGVGNLSSSQGRCKMLDNANILMRSLKAWGIGTTYSQMFTRLRESEGVPHCSS